MDTSASPEQLPATPAQSGAHLREVALLFLRLGFTAFGGPAAHIALMEDEAVTRRRWLRREQFLDLLGIANLLPGPSSSELAIYLGYTRAGWAGLMLGGACFILPAALLTAAIAWAYVRFGSLPQAGGVLYGIRPVVVAIVLQALWRLGRTALKDGVLVAVGIAAAALSLAGLGPVWVLLVCSGVPLLAKRARGLRAAITSAWASALPVAGAGGVAAGAAATAPVSLGGLFLVFLKLGAVVFGSGYVLLAFLRADLVERLHWLTERQLLDAVAVGQITPGPVFSTATFLGYLLAGSRGAAVATAAIFLPAFLLVAATGPFLRRLRSNALAATILDGVTVASLGLMAAVSFYLARAAFVDFPSALVGLLAATLLLRVGVNSTWLILGGALFGVAWSSLPLR